jgi:hypothetical protein
MHELLRNGVSALLLSSKSGYQVLNKIKRIDYIGVTNVAVSPLSPVATALAWF